MSTLELAYRSFLRVDRQPDLLKHIDEQMHSWLRRKKWDGKGLVPGEIATVADGVTGVVIRESHPDGSQGVRFVFDQDQGKGRWLTQVTAYRQQRHDTGWIWVDLSTDQRQRQVRTPALVKNLVGVLDARDGIGPLTDEPVIVRPGGVEELLERVQDPQRRGLLFIAGSTPDLSLEEWRTHVGKILAQTAGLAAGYVLDPLATKRFAELAGDDYRAVPWTIRTYHPGVDLDDPDDGRRHRFLGTDTIIEGSTDSLANLLGHRAKVLSLEVPIDEAAMRVHRRFRDTYDDIVFDTLVAAPTRELDDTGKPDTITPPTPTPVDETAPDHTPTVSAAQSDILSALGEVMQQVLGRETWGREEVIELGNHAGAHLRLDTSAARQRLHEVADQRDKRDAELADLRTQLEEALLEAAVAEESRALVEQEARHLRGELAKAGNPDTVWQPPEDPRDRIPTGFSDILRWFKHLPHVEFTGDDSATEDIDRVDDTGKFAITCWEQLCALDDYARAKLEGKISCGVKGYLEETPGGYRTTGPKKHASNESNTTRTTPKFAKPRTLPVPVEVDPAEEVLMAAHFRIGKRGMYSPRMHYYDDVDGTGKVYVGYIGKHLDNTMT